ncbi:hypothetical protein BS333_13820 [Vibrio azureus]|uniref:Endonuclease/exonuclease/phosphatase domain-containing protein n=1 Tax=Vibrio azureus NBRC 104587 TaxID=1219077 RepID=U3AU42_9VIBR|nr:endonuclease/exonuclease/phosphatase family protein [Vibrio azureus]AUI87495.1 hypothetical protein BS333_13820 [Vibrio azureus]GAD77265.1 hypothetical protein VAZ01S_069_00130 [Vibrio azureus NBRC 104587]
MIRSFIFSLFILLLAACDGSGGLPKQGSGNTDPVVVSSKPILNITGIPQKTFAGDTLTLHGTAWDDSTDITSIHWSSTGMKLIDQDIQLQSNDSEQQPTRFTAKFRVDDVLEPQKATILGTATALSGQKSDNQAFELTIFIKESIDNSKPSVSIPHIILDKMNSSVTAGQTVTVTGKTWDKFGDITKLNWKAQHLKLIRQSLIPATGDSALKPLSFSATFEVDDAPQATSATIEVSSVSSTEHQSPYATMTLAIEPDTKPAPIALPKIKFDRLPLTAVSGRPFVVTGRAWDEFGGTASIAWDNSEHFAIIDEKTELEADSSSPFPIYFEATLVALDTSTTTSAPIQASITAESGASQTTSATLTIVPDHAPLSQTYINLENVPDSVKSGETFTVSGSTWSDDGDVKSLEWTTPNLTLLKTTLIKPGNDSEQNPKFFTATFVAETLFEVDKTATISVIAKSTEYDESVPASDAITIIARKEDNRPVEISRPKVVILSAPMDSIDSGDTFTITGKTWDNVGDVASLNWTTENATLIEQAFTPAEGDSKLNPNSFTAKFKADQVRYDLPASVSVVATSTQQMDNSPQAIQFTIISRNFSDASNPHVLIESEENTMSSGEEITITGAAWDSAKGDIASLEWDTENLTLVSEVFEPIANDSEENKVSFQATFRAKEVTADLPASITVTAHSDKGEQIQSKLDDLTIIARKESNERPVISKPTVTLTPSLGTVRPGGTVTLTAEAYSTNANIDSIEWKTDNSNLSLLNSDDIPTGSTDSKDKPLTLSAEFQASDFVSLEQANITVIVRDGSAGIPTSKSAKIELKPWSKPTLVKVTATPEVSSGQTIAFELDAFDEDSYISHVNWFTDSPNGEVTLPSYDVPSGHQNDSADNLLEIDTFFETKDGLLNDLDVNVWAEVTSFNGTQSITDKQPVKIKKAVRPTIGVMTHAYRGDHQHLNPTQPIQDNDQITISATASAEAATAGLDEIKITSYRWSQMPDDEVELTLDESEQSIPVQDQKNTVETPLNITLPKTGKDGSDSETIYNLKLIVTDERGLESEAKEFELKVKPRTQLKVITANVFLIPFSTVERDKRVSEYLKVKNDLFDFNDVVVLNEAFAGTLAGSYTQRLFDGIKTTFPYRTDPNEDSGLRLNKGVVVLSKEPIIQPAVYRVFAQACGEDEGANKGFIHVKIRKNDKIYNIIATHTQADTDACIFGSTPESIRKAQFEEIKQYIDESLRTKAMDTSEYLYIVGDLNVVKGSAEHAKMMSILRTNEPVHRGLKYSWDPHLNSLASYKNSGWKQDGQLLDYILSVKGFAQPRAWHNVVLDPAVKDVYYDVIPVPSFNAGRHYLNDLSDHFPAIGFEYLEAGIPKKSFRGQNKRYNTIKFRHQDTGEYIKAGASTGIVGSWSAGDYVLIGAHTDEADIEWAIDSQYPSYWLNNDTNSFPTCLLDDSFVEIESLRHKSYFLNYTELYPSYYKLYTNASKWLSIEKVDDYGHRLSGCIENGDKIYLRDGADTSSSWSYASRVVSSGVPYFRINEYRADADIFVVEMPEAIPLDWSDLPD